MKILVLDANQRSALAATRSLGSKGVHVVVADETRETLSGSSKYCSESFQYPSPYNNPEDFITTLKEEAIRRSIHVIFPMTEISTYFLLKYRHQFTGVNIPFAPFETFELLTDKWRLSELAHQLDIPIPMTYYIKNNGDLSDIYSKLKFPVVLKPYRSRVLLDGKWTATSVKYASSVTELENTVVNTKSFNKYPFLLQEYIQGEGRGIFTLYNQGEPIIFFAHRRLREKPPSGGVSVLSESIEVDPHIREIAEKILNYVKWHGVAMVEFKVSSEGIPYLMEVNARFWGSLQLAIDAGVDFPYLLYRLSIGERLEKINGYKTGIKNRWLLGDLDHLYLVFKDRSGLYLTASSKWRILIRVLNLFAKNTRYEVNRWDDLRPFLFELRQYLRN